MANWIYVNIYGNFQCQSRIDRSFFFLSSHSNLRSALSSDISSTRDTSASMVSLTAYSKHTSTRVWSCWLNLKAFHDRLRRHKEKKRRRVDIQIITSYVCDHIVNLNIVTFSSASSSASSISDPLQWQITHDYSPAIYLTPTKEQIGIIVWW